MVDLTKPCITKAGKRAIIYCRDAPGLYPVHGRIDGTDAPQTWTAEGRYQHGSESDRDLENCHVAAPRLSW